MRCVILPTPGPLDANSNPDYSDRFKWKNSLVRSIRFNSAVNAEFGEAEIPRRSGVWAFLPQGVAIDINSRFTSYKAVGVAHDKRTLNIPFSEPFVRTVIGYTFLNGNEALRDSQGFLPGRIHPIKRFVLRVSSTSFFKTLWNANLFVSWISNLPLRRMLNSQPIGTTANATSHSTSYIFTFYLLALQISIGVWHRSQPVGCSLES